VLCCGRVIVVHGSSSVCCQLLFFPLVHARTALVGWGRLRPGGPIVCGAKHEFYADTGFAQAHGCTGQCGRCTVTERFVGGRKVRQECPGLGPFWNCKEA